jgi:hypothetical protein
MANAANVAKVVAGGSGDNVVSDGFIKTVEKVWIDSYVITEALTTSGSVVIAKIPANKKITDVIVSMPGWSADTGTTGSLALGTGTTTKITGTTHFLGVMELASGITGRVTTLTSNSTAATFHLSGDKIGTVTPKDIDIHLRIDQQGGGVITLTGGTIRTIVKYT